MNDGPFNPHLSSSGFLLTGQDKRTGSEVPRPDRLTFEILSRQHFMLTPHEQLVLGRTQILLINLVTGEILGEIICVTSLHSLTGQLDILNNRKNQF